MKKITALLALSVLLLSLAAALAEDPAVLTDAQGLWEYVTAEDGTALLYRPVGRDAESVTLPAALDGLTVTGATHNPFVGCDKLTTVTAEDGCALSTDGTFLYAADGTLLACLPSVSGAVAVPDGVERIAGEAFSGSAVTEITLPASVRELGSWVFSSCSNLTRADLSACSVEALPDGAFSSCPALASVSLPACLTAVGNQAFFGCTALSDLALPDAVTTIGSEAFENCRALTSFAVPASLQSAGTQAFSLCLSLSAFTGSSPAYSTADGVLFSAGGSVLACYPAGAPADAYAVPEGTAELAPYAFAYTRTLTSVSLPSTLRTVGEGAFTCCSKLASVSIPQGVEALEAKTFAKCSALSSVILPEGLLYIGDEAFSSCKSLAELRLPETLAYLGDNVFASCSSLARINLPDSLQACGVFAFSGTSPDLTVTASVGSFADSACTENNLRIVRP